MSKPSIKLALVVDDGESYDEGNVQVVDIVSIQPLDDFVFLLQTKPFNNVCLKKDAGENLLSYDVIEKMLLSKFK